MHQSIEEIMALRREGKLKWGRDLIEFLKPYFEKNCRYDQIIKMLDIEYNFKIDINSLTNLKFRYYEKPSNKLTIRPINNSLKTPENKHLAGEQKQNKIAQNQDSKSTHVIEDFDFGACLDEDIVEKQKRDLEALKSKNSKGAKW